VRLIGPNVDPPVWDCPAFGATTIWQRGSQIGRTAHNHLADQFEVVNESSCLPRQLIINTTKSFIVQFGSFLEINPIYRTICRFNMNLQPWNQVEFRSCLANQTKR